MAKCAIQFTILIVLFLLTVGLLLHIIGFSTSYWTNSSNISNYHTGLWRTCFLRSPHRCISAPYTAAWFKATQAFEVLGVCAGILSLLVFLFYVFVNRTSGNKVLFITTIVSVGIAAGCTILGIIIYGSNQTNIDWSFAFTVIGGILYGVTGVLMIFILINN